MIYDVFWLDILVLILLLILLVGLFTIMTPNRWTNKRTPFAGEYPAVDITPHNALMDAIRKTRE
jgi:hypothetical protein